MNTFASLSSNFGTHMTTFAGIAAYSIIGCLIMLGCVLFSNWVMKINLKKELLEDQNPAMGTMFAGLFIAIAVIIAACIVSP